MFVQKIKLINMKRFHDSRGFFEETYTRKKFQEFDIDVEFVQDNHSFSIDAGTIRGLHFQSPPHAQAKLVRCISGAIYDVVVDIRIGSPDFGKWKGYELNAKNANQLFVPIGYAHGFITLVPNTEVLYKCTDYYFPESEGSIHWDSCGIHWPYSDKPILSEKDNIAPFFKSLESPFIYGENS